MTTMHMDDGALVRWLDGEAVGEERRDLAAHIAACATCDARLATLRDRAARVSRALVTLDERSGVRVRHGGRVGLRAAASVAVLLGVGFAVEPVRAWILDRAESVWTAVTGDRGPQPPTPPAEQTAAEPAAGSITFVPSGDVFVVEVAVRQEAGELVIETVGTGTASAAVTDGTGRESFVVLPSGLRIVNDAVSRAGYVVRVPATLRAVVLAVGDAPRRRYEPVGVGERWAVPLGPDGRDGRD